MRGLESALVIAVLVLASGTSYAFPTNWLSGKLGASVTTAGLLDDGADPNVLLSDGLISKGAFFFKKTDQEQVFTVDLGQSRELDRVQFGSVGYGEPRNARLLRISISEVGPDGPFQTVLERTKVAYFQILRLPLVKARWLRFDLGKGSEGAQVHSVRIYRSYEHPRMPEVAQLLAGKIKPGISGLEGFYSASDKGDWAAAVKELRAYFARVRRPEAPPKPDVDLSYAEDLATGKLNFAGIARSETVPIDWSYMETRDWYEHKNFINRGRMTGYPLSAYYDTGDAKWLERFRAVFYDWVDANPCPPETIYADMPTWRTLDTAMRLGWLLAGFPKATVSGVDDELWANFAYLIWQHADYLHRDKVSGGNWLSTITSAVMDTALDFPEFADQREWMLYAKNGFETNVLRDIYADGKEKEDAPGYVCMAYGGMFRTLKALDQAKIEVRPEVLERMDKVQDFLGAITQPNGDTAAIGDWGGGPPEIIEETSRYFKREDIRYILTKGREGTMPARASVNFPHGNWSVMRSPFDEKPYEDARHLVFKSSYESHGHLDVLNTTVYAYGRPLLIDPGIRSYERADGARYVQTAYHNTICVDGRNTERGGGDTDRWVSNAGLDYLSASHDRYKGLVVRRSILFVKPDYWLVRDEITGEGSHTYDQNWHFPEDAGITEDTSTHAVRTNYPDGNLLLLPVDPSGLESQETEFRIAKKRMAAGYGEVTSKGWQYRRVGATPCVFETLLYPYKGASAPNVSVRQLSQPADGFTAVEVRNGKARDYIVISHSGPRSMRVAQPLIEAEGEIAVIRTIDGRPMRVSGARLKSVKLAGKVLVDEAEPREDLDRVTGG
jgi:hypothetical protein